MILKKKIQKMKQINSKMIIFKKIQYSKIMMKIKRKNLKRNKKMTKIYSKNNKFNRAKVM